MKINSIILILVLVVSYIFTIGEVFAYNKKDELLEEKQIYTFYAKGASPLNRIIEVTLQEAFDKIGKKIRFKLTGSSQRALIMANEMGDGDIMRVGHIKKVAPKITCNLVQIPESIMDVEFYVYTKNKSFPVKGWSSLSNLHNGIRSGAKILEKNVPGKRTILPDSERLFMMLEQGRIDTVIEHGVIADYLIQKLNIKNIKKLSPPLVSMPGYPLIHKKHKALIPAIAKSLSEMRAAGRFEKIKEEVYTELLVQ